MTESRPVPADVYRAARRLYIGTSADPAADDATVRAWAADRWPTGIPADPLKLAFWVMSIAAQEGCQ